MKPEHEDVLVLVDVQGRLAEVMWERDRLLDRLGRLAAGAVALGIPILCTEQAPEKLGPTHSSLMERMPNVDPIPKKHFSCLRAPRFQCELERLDSRRVWLAGIETHVCVYQTAVDLLAAGYRVEIITDAVSSRSEEDRRIGLERMRARGAGWMTVEMALFESVEIADGAVFRAVHRIVK